MKWWKCQSCMRFNWSTDKHEEACWRCGKSVHMKMPEYGELKIK